MWKPHTRTEIAMVEVSEGWGVGQALISIRPKAPTTKHVSQRPKQNERLTPLQRPQHVLEDDAPPVHRPKVYSY